MRTGAQGCCHGFCRLRRATRDPAATRGVDAGPRVARRRRARAAAAGRAGRRARLRDVVVHGRGLRGAARGVRRGRDRSLRREPVPGRAQVRPRAGDLAVRHHDRGRRAVELTAAPVTAITGVADCPVVAGADEAIVLDFADEESVVQTVFATTTLDVAARFARRAARGRHRARRGPSSMPLQPYDPALDGVEQFTFLGQDWVYGIAQEAALKMREAAQLWTEAYPQMEYRHGPISIAERGPRGVGVRRAGARPRRRHRGHRRATRRPTTSTRWPISSARNCSPSRARRPRASIADRPRHLTRSVVLSRS